MNYANKKINQRRNLAQQTAQIITNVAALASKNVIRLAEDTVYLYPQIWKDKTTAINWINCLLHYYLIKRQFKQDTILNFKNIETDELIGSVFHKKVKVLIFS